MSTRDLIIFGAGGFGREVKSMVEGGGNAGHGTPQWKVTGFIDDLPENRGQDINGTPCFGALEETALRRQGEETWCLIAIGDNEGRRNAARRLEKAGWKAALVIHHTAAFPTQVEFGGGGMIGAHVTISPQVRIGKHVIINTRASLGHHATVGDYAQISLGASLLGHSKVERGAFVGAHGVVMANVTVGAWATVGVGTPAMVSVEPGTTICLPLARVLFKRELPPDDESDG
jgi:sugar O-acyltransferase (sialic acid O-acetyltransferase NeuD family)